MQAVATEEMSLLSCWVKVSCGDAESRVAGFLTYVIVVSVVMKAVKDETQAPEIHEACALQIVLVDVWALTTEMSAAIFHVSAEG